MISRLTAIYQYDMKFFFSLQSMLTFTSITALIFQTTVTQLLFKLPSQSVTQFPASFTVIVLWCHHIAVVISRGPSGSSCSSPVCNPDFEASPVSFVFSLSTCIKKKQTYPVIKISFLPNLAKGATSQDFADFLVWTILKVVEGN